MIPTAPSFLQHRVTHRDRGTKAAGRGLLPLLLVGCILSLSCVLCGIVTAAYLIDAQAAGSRSERCL